MTSLLILLLSANASAAETCKATRETVEIPHSGQYHRMHPSGNYFLYTNGSGVTLVDITDRKHPKKIDTPMQNETYPVEGASGGWDLMASPASGGAEGPNGGMDFYRFSDMTNGAPNRAKPVYQDKEFGEWYHSTAELPGSTNDTKKVRMLLFSQRMYKDYEMKINKDGAVTSTKSLQQGNLCDNIFKRKEPSAEARQAHDKIESEIQPLAQEFQRAVAAGKREEADAIVKKINEKREDAQAALYGPEYVEARKKFTELSGKLTELRGQAKNLPEVKSSEEKTNKLREEYDKKTRDLYNSADLAKIQLEMQEIGRRYNAEPGNRPALLASHERLSQQYRQKEEELINDPQLLQIKKAMDSERKAFSEFMRTNSLFKQVTKVSEEQDEAQTNIWALREGKQIGQPVLSKDGTYVAGLVGNKTHVYKIDEKGNCELAGQTKYQGSKVSFSYPEKGKVPQITFTAEGGASTEFGRRVIVYDLEKDTEVYVSDEKDSTPYYPGFTKDGRVMFKTQSGVTIVDPKQVPGSNVVCNSTSNSKSNENQSTRGTR